MWTFWSLGLDLLGEFAPSFKPLSCLHIYGGTLLTSNTSRLALANWFRSSNIRVRLLEKKPDLTPRGQAEGLKSTTVEVFESLGIGHQIWAEAWRLEEIAIWGAEKADDGVITGTKIKREQIMQDRVPELGKTREIMLQQCRYTSSISVTYALIL